MKRYGKRCAALALALTMALLCALPQPALASWALGEELMERTVELASGAALTGQSLWSASRSDLRTEHYITYTPGGAVKPVVFSGTYVASTNTVASAAAQMEAQGWRVVAAINGGFFNSDGTIVGMLMTDGVVRALDVFNYAMLGFTRDGQVFIDESAPVLTAAWTAMEPAVQPEPDTQPDPETEPEPELTAAPRSFRVAGFNAYRTTDYNGGLYLYNKDFSSRVNSLGTCVYAILRPVGEDGMKMNGSMTFEVVSVTDTAVEGTAFEAISGYYPEELLRHAGEEQFGTEFLDYAMAVKTVGTVEDAVDHINRYGSGHSEAIVTADERAAAMFRRDVDAACVYVNAPTSFTDGAQFGLGAEIGISTQKLHARGPMALREITTYKWLIDGNGQTRP